MSHIIDKHTMQKVSVDYLRPWYVRFSMTQHDSNIGLYNSYSLLKLIPDLYQNITQKIESYCAIFRQSKFNYRTQKKTHLYFSSSLVCHSKFILNFHFACVTLRKKIKRFLFSLFFLCVVGKPAIILNLENKISMK